MADMIGGSSIRALVVDDSSANALVLSAMLQRFGFATDTAESGMEALEKACSRQYDLIMMDYLMPDMDGLETTRQIVFLSNTGRKPIIIGVSATIDLQVKDLFRQAGADYVVKKPVDAEELEEKLREYNLLKQEIAGDTGHDMSYASVDFLNEIDGLNYEEGLSLMAGNLENYMKVLNVCVRNVWENYNKIDVIRNTEQMESMALYFHSLKGIFLNIGAEELAKQSKMLEFAAKEFENLYVYEQMDSYMESVKKMHDQLESVCNEYKKSLITPTGGAVMSDDEFTKNVQELKGYIEDFEYISIVETLEKMLNGSDTAHRAILEDINENIQNFQYDTALEILNREFLSNN